MWVLCSPVCYYFRILSRLHTRACDCFFLGGGGGAARCGCEELVLLNVTPISNSACVCVCVCEVQPFNLYLV